MATQSALECRHNVTQRNVPPEQWLEVLADRMMPKRLGENLRPLAMDVQIGVPDSASSVTEAAATTREAKAVHHPGGSARANG